MSASITPFLWFDHSLADALAFYAGVFPRFVEHGRQQQSLPDGTTRLFSAQFEINGQRFMGLNGGPVYTFSPAVSFFISCPDQDTVDALWDKLLDGGQAMRCGWLTDRYGITWQVVPDGLFQLLHQSDRERAGRAMQAMMGMVKLDIHALRRAADGT